MDSVLPATAMEPLRADVDVLAATLYLTVPLPVPPLPDVIVTHPKEVAAVQVHVFALAVMVILPVPFP